MADTAFDAFTLVTSLLSTDKFLAQRSAGGVNFTLATLAAASAKLGGDGTASLPGFAFASDSDTGIFRSADNTLSFVTGGIERLTLNATGLGIGTATPNARLHVSGAQVVTGDFILGGSGGTQYIVRPNVAGAKDIVFAVLGGSALDGVQFNSTTVRHQNDNAGSLGIGAYRWSVVYAATSAISTSDEREKVWIGIREDSRAVWLRIASRIFDELGFYQWTEAVDEKGAAARMHFGARAQRVWQIVADEGLAPPLVNGLPVAGWAGPPPPAFLCFDEWEAEHVEEPVYSKTLVGEDGEPLKTGTRTVVSRAAGNRFGFRTDQLGMLLSWALHQRIAVLEAAAT